MNAKWIIGLGLITATLGAHTSAEACTAILNETGAATFRSNEQIAVLDASSGTLVRQTLDAPFTEMSTVGALDLYAPLQPSRLIAAPADERLFLLDTDYSSMSVVEISGGKAEQVELASQVEAASVAFDPDGTPYVLVANGNDTLLLQGSESMGWETLASSTFPACWPDAASLVVTSTGEPVGFCGEHGVSYSEGALHVEAEGLITETVVAADGVRGAADEAVFFALTQDGELLRVVRDDTGWTTTSIALLTKDDYTYDAQIAAAGPNSVAVALTDSDYQWSLAAIHAEGSDWTRVDIAVPEGRNPLPISAIGDEPVILSGHIDLAVYEPGVDGSYESRILATIGRQSGGPGGCAISSPRSGGRNAGLLAVLSGLAAAVALRLRRRRY